jgi:hypothetical protein
MSTQQEQPTPKDRAAGLREIAKDPLFTNWPEAREELEEAARLLDSMVHQ